MKLIFAKQSECVPAVDDDFGPHQRVFHHVHSRAMICGLIHEVWLLELPTEFILPSFCLQTRNLNYPTASPSQLSANSSQLSANSASSGPFICWAHSRGLRGRR